MKIRHKEYGDVEEVEKECGTQSPHRQWNLRKDARLTVFYEEDGWEAVPETRLVDVTGEVEIGNLEEKALVLNGLVVGRLTDPSHCSWRKVDRYDLPKDFVQMLNNSLHDAFEKRHTYLNLTMNWLQQFKKPFLIIESEEPCQ